MTDAGRGEGRRVFNMDIAAAILHAAGEAYFESPCDACKGKGVLVAEDPRPGIPAAKRDCPCCDATGVAQMPDADEIVQAAHMIADR